MIVIYNDMDMFECARAERSDSEVILYDNDGNVTQHITNIIGDEWNFFRIVNGEWTDVIKQPSEEDNLQMKLDRIQADLDYCLMLLE